MTENPSFSDLQTELSPDLIRRLTAIISRIDDIGFKAFINPKLHEGRGWVLQGAKSFKMTEFGMEVLEEPQFAIHYTTDESRGRQMMFVVQISDMDPQDERNEPTLASWFSTPEEAVESLIMTLTLQNRPSSQ